MRSRLGELKFNRMVPLWIVCFVVSWAAGALAAEDVFYELPVSKLKITDGKLPEPPPNSSIWQWNRRQYRTALFPYVRVDGTGEAFFNQDTFNWLTRDAYDSLHLCVRAPKGGDVSGWLFLPNSDFTGMVRLRFSIPVAAAARNQKQRKVVFYKNKEKYYRRMMQNRIPGAAWFRWQEYQAKLDRGVKNPLDVAVGRNGRRRNIDADLLDLFSGGRAISENLALDRQLSLNSTSMNATVPIDSLVGITIKEMDWKKLTANAKPKLDPLAKQIPADQHALFFPTFDGLLALMRESESYGTPILQTLEPRTEDAGVARKYQRQLCLQSSGLSRLFGARIIASVAMTGSDPYLRTGSDVALLFEAKNLKLLRTYLLSKQAAAATGNEDVKGEKGNIDGVPYVGVRSPDRRICSYLATFDNVVIVTNSLYQLGRLVSTDKGQTPALGSLLEYKFFRHRYKLGEENESAFLVLSDAAIRRWCSPRWRIGNARRTRAAAVLADLQARSQDALVRGAAKPGKFDPPYSLEGLGDVQLTSRGVKSSIYGTLEFHTPIAELSLGKVTPAEAAAYNRWRASYLRLWNRFFDPIAVRISVDKKRLAADVTVMPLALGTDYAWLARATRKGALTAKSGDRHADALINMTLGINSILWGFPKTPITSVSFYVEDDPFWSRLEKAKDPDEYMRKHGRGFPAAIHLDSPKPDDLLKEVLGLLPFLQKHLQESRGHKGHPYVKITWQRENHGFDVLSEIYVAKLPQGVVVSFNEAMIHRSIERNFSRAEDAEKKKPRPADVALRPWIGKHLGLQLNQGAMRAFGTLGNVDYRRLMQVRCWNNLPILNEWKRRYRDRDPLEIYEQIWGAKLYCPGGGQYVWNEKWQTMESTIYGHPGQPKPGPKLPPVLANLRSIDFGVTFENDGLRAKTVLQRDLGE